MRPCRCATTAPTCRAIACGSRSRPDEQKQLATLLDVTRFYDPVKRQVINLPENYPGVAARIAAMSWEMKFLKDRALLDSLLDRAAVPVHVRRDVRGRRTADREITTGYSNEYARYVWEAAQIAGRKDLLDKLRPSLKAQMRSGGISPGLTATAIPGAAAWAWSATWTPSRFPVFSR